MLLWILFAVLTAAVVGVVAAPMIQRGCDRGGDVPGSADDADVAVYRDLLEEIERDRANGTIEAGAADSARAEVARRLLALAEPDGGATVPDDADQSFEPDTVQDGQQSFVFAGRVAGGIAAVVTFASLTLYLLTGSPGVPGQPKRATPTPTAERSDVEALVADVEARLRFAPQDGAGWDVVAPVYFRLKRFDDARVAYRRAIELLGPTVKRLRGLGLAEIKDARGEITPVARQVFEKILAIDPKDVAARLWIARAFEQDGDATSAIGAYQAMLDVGEKDGKWRPIVEKRIAELSKGDEASQSAATSAKKGEGSPSAGAGRVRGLAGSDMEAVRGMSREERAQFIAGMVERLAVRVGQDGSNFDAWLQLIRAYAVLGRTVDANKVLAEARDRFARNEARARALDDLARQFQLGS